MTATDNLYIGVGVFSVVVVLLIIGYIGNTIFTQLQSSPINESATAVQAITDTQDIVQNKFDYFGLFVFLGFVFSLLITSWIVGANPIFFIVYFIVTVLNILLGAVWSNVHETISAAFPSMTAYFPISNHLLQYLPYYLAVVAFIGMIAMFAKPYINVGEGGL